MKRFFTVAKTAILAFLAELLAPLNRYCERHFRLAVSDLSTAPNLQEALQYSVNRPGSAEVVRQSLYDFLLYPAAGSTSFTFFQNPIGQGLSSHPGNANNVKGPGDTNMESAGQLPSPKMFLATSIELVFYAGSVSTANTYTPQVQSAFIAVPTAAQAPISLGAINDSNFVLQGGWLNFFVGSKTYLNEASLVRFPPKARFELDAAVATNSATTGAIGAASVKAGGRPYYLDPPVLLVPNQNFVVTVNFPVAQATPSTFNGRMGVIIDGFLYRNAQ